MSSEVHPLHLVADPIHHCPALEQEQRRRCPSVTLSRTWLMKSSSIPMSVRASQGAPPRHRIAIRSSGTKKIRPRIGAPEGASPGAPMPARLLRWRVFGFLFLPLFLAGDDRRVLYVPCIAVELVHYDLHGVREPQRL